MHPPAWFLAAVGIFAAATSFAQSEIPLWPEGTPLPKFASPETSEDKRETGRQDRWLSYVSQPTLALYLPKEAKQPMPVMLVVPGGGYRYVCIDKEGIEPAHWLVEHGIAAVVLKYRTIDPKIERNSRSIEPVFIDPPRAVRAVRFHAKEWNLDPNRIGVMGFSAGAVMALRLTSDADAGLPGASDPIDRVDSHPNAVVLVYGAMANKLHAPANLPPFLIVHAADDPKAPVGAVSAITKYIQEGKGSYEVHIFRRGDHGFGMLPKQGTVQHWPDIFAHWLEDIGFVDSK